MGRNIPQQQASTNTSSSHFTRPNTSACAPPPLPQSLLPPACPVLPTNLRQLVWRNDERRMRDCSSDLLLLLLHKRQVVC